MDAQGLIIAYQPKELQVRMGPLYALPFALPTVKEGTKLNAMEEQI